MTRSVEDGDRHALRHDFPALKQALCTILDRCVTTASSLTFRASRSERRTQPPGHAQASISSRREPAGAARRHHVPLVSRARRRQRDRSRLPSARRHMRCLRDRSSIAATFESLEIGFARRQDPPRRGRRQPRRSRLRVSRRTSSGRARPATIAAAHPRGIALRQRAGAPARCRVFEARDDGTPLTRHPRRLSYHNAPTNFGATCTWLHPPGRRLCAVGAGWSRHAAPHTSMTNTMALISLFAFDSTLPDSPDSSRVSILVATIVSGDEGVGICIRNLDSRTLRMRARTGAVARNITRGLQGEMGRAGCTA